MNLKIAATIIVLALISIIGGLKLSEKNLYKVSIVMSDEAGTKNITTEMSKDRRVGNTIIYSNDDYILTYSETLLSLTDNRSNKVVKYLSPSSQILLNDDPRDKYKTIIASNNKSSISLFIVNNPVKDE